MRVKHLLRFLMPRPGFLACRGTSNREPIYTHRVYDAHIIPMGVFLLHEMGRSGNRGRIRRHEHACIRNLQECVFVCQPSCAFCDGPPQGFPLAEACVPNI